jgi:hypothetical protein
MARGDLTLYDSILSSNLRNEEKSVLRRMYDKALQMPEALQPSRKQIHGSLTAFRQGAESLIAGMALGAINVESPGGLEPGGVHVDGVAGLLFLAGSGIGAESDMASTARNIGSVCTGVFGCRVTTKLLVEKRLAKGQAIPKHLSFSSSHSGEVPVSSHNNVSQDPIVLAAEGL